MRKKNLVSLVWLTKYEEGHIPFFTIIFEGVFYSFRKECKFSSLFGSGTIEKRLCFNGSLE